MISASEPIGLIAGRGIYPFEWIAGARRSGVSRIVAAAFEHETDPALAQRVDDIHWMRVGQLGKLIKTFRSAGLRRAVMAGQIRPGHLFDLRPDFRALMLLARLRRRNAASLFGAIATELSRDGIELLPATRYLEDQLAKPGWRVGPKPRARALDDAAFAFTLAKEISQLDIGQLAVVKNGTVLAVEGFEGTNDCLRRGGALGKSGVIAAKVAKPGQDLRFDVPVIGPDTVRVCAEAGVSLLAIEPHLTLLLQPNLIATAAAETKTTILALAP